MAVWIALGAVAMGLILFGIVIYAALRKKKKDSDNAR